MAGWHHWLDGHKFEWTVGVDDDRESWCAAIHVVAESDTTHQLNWADVGNLISGSCSFSKSSLNIWKFAVHVLLKPGLENFEHYFTSLWDECNCAVACAFFVIAFLWDWNENWPFPVLWPLLSVSHLLAYWAQHFHSIIFQDLYCSTGIPSSPLTLFIVMLPKAHLTSYSFQDVWL